jgi:hypothetical protein
MPLLTVRINDHQIPEVLYFPINVHSLSPRKLICSSWSEVGKKKNGLVLRNLLSVTKIGIWKEEFQKCHHSDYLLLTFLNPWNKESTNYLRCTERELVFFIPFRLGTISQRWWVNKTLKNIGSQHSWVPGILKKIYSSRLNAKTQTRAGIHFVEWLQHRLGARWIGSSIPRRDKRCLLQLSNRPWSPQYREHSLGTKRPARETDYSTSSNNVKNVWSHTSIRSHVFM